ncbi:glycosyltransferase [Haloarcula sp. JP-L23]|uniref:glycosyltransferase n=1 Tax=Haloarcula sp. JP-L23 TaxID=2716717 RepID=UPI00140ED60C|nr:glycosyltransferase [Haloarcula sp. JP-L23]
MLVPREEEVHQEYFEADELVSLGVDSRTIEAKDTVGLSGHFRRAVSNPRGAIVREAFEYVEATDCDLLHLLHADDVLKEVHRHGQGCQTPVVGTINGSYFRVQDDTRTRLAVGLVDCGMEDIALGVPDVLSRRGPWNHLNLARSLRDGVVKDFFVASKLGRDAIRRVTGPTVNLPKIPDPIDCWWDDDLDKSTARTRLNLPEEEFLLMFFGEMRTEKGVDVLVDALASYSGPPLTAVFAGRPVDVDTDEFGRLDGNPAVSVRTVLEFVPQSDVKAYFKAADVFVLPYRQSFGTYRTSGVFHKACGSLRPVIAPAFGMFEHLIEGWQLGTTYRPGSSVSLRRVIERTRTNIERTYDHEQMRAYAESQTYEVLAGVTAETYERVLTGGVT